MGITLKDFSVIKWCSGRVPKKAAFGGFLMLRARREGG
jgi:hypothetical protein